MRNEEAYIHVDVIADFWVFRPTIGSQLKGVVNKKSDGHVSCVVHGCFNVPCHRPQDTPENAWCGRKVKLGQVVRFTVLKTDMTQKVPFILGDLQADSLVPVVMAKSEFDPIEEVDQDEFEQRIRADGKALTDSDSGIDSVGNKKKRKSTGNEDEDDEENTGISPKKKKRKTTEVKDEDEKIEMESPKKKKKKKKSKDRESEADESLSQAEEEVKIEVNPSPKKKNKKDKKIKEETPEEVTPSKSKKKKKDKEIKTEILSPSKPSTSTSTPTVQTPVSSSKKSSKPQTSTAKSTPSSTGKKGKKEEKKKVMSMQEQLIQSMMANISPGGKKMKK